MSHNHLFKVQLQRQFQTLANQNNNLKRQPRLQADAGTQTDTHIKDSYIDKVSSSLV